MNKIAHFRTMRGGRDTILAKIFGSYIHKLNLEMREALREIRLQSEYDFCR